MIKNSVSIISARGGSKGLPDKNIKTFNGKPLILYTIEQSLRCFERTIVTSDSKKILNIASNYKSVELLERPKNLAKDSSPKLPVLRHAINKLNINCDIVADIQPTSPLRKDKSILLASKQLMKNKNAENIVSISKSNIHPQYNLVFKKGENISLLNPPKKPLTGRNKFNNNYVLNGAFFIWKLKTLLSDDNSIIRKNTLYFETKKDESVDIDDLIDFRFAEFISKN